MITIHHEKETVFSKNGYGAIDDYVMSQEVTWEMNGQFYAYLEYPAFLDKSAYLVNKNILRVPVPFMEDQLFRIYRVRKVLGFIQVEARHIFYDLMDNLIEDTNIVGKTGSQAIQQLLGATQYEHRFIGFSDISTSNNARMVRYNPVEALLDDSKANTFVSRWGGEIVRDNFVIRMARQMGTDRGVRIQHRKDLTAYIATIDESTVVTRIMPVGFDGLKLPELYIDSPLLDPDNPKIGVIRYENVKAAIGEYADDNGAVPLEEAYELLRNHAKAEFSNNHIDEPEMTVTVNFVTLHNTKEYADFAQLQEIHQGDVVRVSVPDEDFEITSRLVAFTSDPLQDNHYTSTTLGNHVYEFTSSTNSVSTLRNEVEALRESVVEVRQSANGKNQSFWGEADPNTLNLNAILGDTYFRSVGEEDVIYQYVEVDGERYWKEIINTANTSEVKKEVERVAEEAEKLAADITEAQQSADDALTEAGISTDLAQTAKDLAQSAEDNAETAKANAQTAINEAGIAVSQAVQAINTADTAKTNAQTALTNAQTALTEAGSAKTTANNLTVRVDDVEAEVELKASQTTVDGLSGTVTNHSTTLTQHANQIASKAESSFVNTIKGAVDTHTTKIAQNATEIASKASASSVNTLTGRVSTAETTITQHAGLIASKASQTEVDAVKGTVSSHTSTLSQHAIEIGARLTSSEVNSLVDGKGFSTVSYVDNKISATADGFNGELARIEGEIPRSYTEENLVKNSKEYIHNNNYLIKSYQLMKQLVLGETYTIVLDGGIGATGSDQQFGVWFDDGNSYQTTLQNLGSGIFRGTFTLRQTGPISGDKSNFRLYNLPNRGAPAKIKWIKLVEGSETDNNYTPSRSDIFTQNEYSVFKTTFDISAGKWDLTHSYVNNNQVKLNNIITNSDGWQNTITYVDNNKTQINETIAQVNSFKQTIGTNGEKIAQMVMTDRLFSTKVLESFEIGGRNYALGTTDKMQYYQNVNLYSGPLIPNNTSKNVYTLSDLGARVGDTFTASIYIGTGGGYGSGLRIDNQTGTTQYNSPIVTNGYSSVTFTVRPQDSEFRFYLRNANNNSSAYWVEASKFKIEKGNKRTDWSPAPEDKANQSEVTQLANNWALTLKSGNDIKTQINATTNGIRLASKLIHLSGQSLIDDAVIKSAHIADLAVTSAKIADASISSAKIINLDVSKLAGNHMSFISGAFVSANGAIRLSGSQITATFNTGYGTQIDGEGFKLFNAGGTITGDLSSMRRVESNKDAIGLNARRNYAVFLGYQGNLGANQSMDALSVDGQTGNIRIHRPIYESSNAVGLEYVRSQLGNVGWGLRLSSTNATNSGIFLADNGQVWIGIGGGSYKQFT